MTRFCTSLLLLIGSSNILVAQSITDGLLLHYKLDGNAIDYTINGHDGILNGPVSVGDVYNNQGMAYYFDGSDDYIDLPNDPSLKPQLPITISYLVKFDFLDLVGTQMFTTDYEQNNYHGVWANLSADGLGHVGIHFGGGQGSNGANNRRTKLSTSTVEVQKWYRLTFVVQSANDMDIYIDCVDAGGSYSGSGPTNIAYSSTPGSIGRVDAHSGLSAYYFSGALDDFSYWNRALSQAEVVSICDGVLDVHGRDMVSDQPRVYPNPFNDKFIIEFQNPKAEPCVAKLFDLQGRLILSSHQSNESVIEMDRNNLPSGVYFYKVIFVEKEGAVANGRIIAN